MSVHQYSDEFVSSLQSRIAALEEIASMQYRMLHDVADREMSLRCLRFIMSDFDYEISDRIGDDWSW